MESFAGDIVAQARKLGADEADVFIQKGRESEVTTRKHNVESIKESRSAGYGLRVFSKGRLGFCFSSDFSLQSMISSAETAISLAEAASADEFNGLPETNGDTEAQNLDLYDERILELRVQEKIDSCLSLEQAAFDFDSRVTNSEGAGFYDGDTTTVISNSRGLVRKYRSTYCYMSCRPVAEQNGKMQSGWWLSYSRHLADLDSPQEVGTIAAERAVRMLGARVPGTSKVPVVFDNVTGSSLLYGVLEALDGDAVFKKASFLAGKLDGTLGAPGLTIVDDGSMRRGLSSAPFDGEGLSTGRHEVISKGILNAFIYDSYTARKAGAKPTANAQRSPSSLPAIGSFNFYMQKGSQTRDEIIGSVKNGLLLTALMGFGANPVTGDYSLGGSGLWIEDGDLAYPVEGLTVASNMLDMLKNIELIGDDLKFMGPVSSPTYRVNGMTISGTS